MLHIGCHLSASKGYYAMGKTALSIGADTFQFFTRNPRGSRAKPLDLNDAQKLNELAAENHFAVLLAHAPYTINPCSANEDTRTFARETMQDDLKRLEATPHNLYNFHPRQPRWTRHRDRRHTDQRNAERHFISRTDHHGFTRDHGRQGHGSRLSF